MRFLKICCFLVAFSPVLVIGQAKTTNPAQAARPVSHILRSDNSDTAYVHLEVQDAQYDFSKNKLPFYFVSKTTAANQSATPTLIIKNTQAVAEPHASVIRKYFSKYLTGSFNLVVNGGSICKTENLNHYKLFPFRTTATGQIEELISYDLTWQVSGNNLRTTSTSSFTTNSVLSSGDWYKIGVTQNGIYKINKTFLNNIGINTTNLDPKKLQIFGNGGKMLPEINGAFRYDDLQENSIQVIGESDGTFDANDYILFYATGPSQWTKTNSKKGLRFKVQKNLYSDTSYYFITVGSSNGKRVNSQASSAASPNLSSDTYDYYNFHEIDLVNFPKSGRDFYGEYFDVNTSYGFSWSDGDFITGDTIRCASVMACASKEVGKFLYNGNGINFIIQTRAINVGAYLEDYASLGSVDTLSPNNTNASTVGINISKLVANSVGWLDKVTINARRRVNVTTKQFCFRDSRVYGPGKVCNFTVYNSLSAPLNLWNVTDPLNPFIQAYNTTGTTLNFVTPVDSLNEFCVAPAVDYYAPSFVGKIQNQNLHAIMQADYIFVTHPLFIKQAQELAAFHQQKEGLSYAIVTTEQIYNEFSSGRQDISGIRDFIRMVYTRNLLLPTALKYVLLVGDGSYDNRTRNLVNNTDFIPTYQSLNSLSATESVTSDDFYALMSPDEGYNAENYGTVDIGVGRFTCKSTTEAKAIITKIQNYYLKDPSFQIADPNPEKPDESPLGDWRNWLLFLADDGDQSIHMRGADALATIIKNIAGSYNSNKIYLDAYQRFSTPGGHRYPDAAEDFLRQIKKGCLIFNYTGHGGEGGLTEERIIDIPTIDGLDNFNRLPLFITATCEFSRYDDPARTSAGELCLLNPKGGAVALLTTCRVAYSSTNDVLNQKVINKLFTKVNGKWPTLGDVVQKTKSELQQSYPYANFHLLGDPAMPLAYPGMKTNTSKINTLAVDTTRLDTLSALAKITITGFVSDTSGHKLTNFNGIVYPTVFDKEQNVVCLVNDPATSLSTVDIVPFQFTLQKNILYHGKAQVTNGDFSFTFLVPKDISFAPGPGRISYYATNGDLDANGYYSRIVVGGESKNIVVDTEGPKVNLYLNDKNFVNGGITNEDPILYANLTDSSGINTLGTSIGHDISAVLDQTGTKPVILNDYYEANLNSYQSGSIRYPFNDLADGDHRLTFKVWDIQNNSNTIYTDFVVAKSADLALRHVLNYPNPFTTNTKFMFEHNQGCNPLRVTIQIFTVSGKAVKTIQKLVVCDGFKPEPIEWDGKDDYGDKLGRGVYIYKLAILDVQNKKAEKIEKLVILN